MLELSIIIVSWKVKEDLKKCLLSIGTSNLENTEVIIVDNNSEDGTVEMINREFSNYTLIKNQSNLGFAKACNLGAKKSSGKYLLFLNPDTEINNEAIVSSLNFMNSQPFVGILGPKILDKDNQVQASVRSFPTFFSATLLLLKLHRLFPHSLSLRRYYMTAFKYDTLRKVNQVMGAFFLVRRNVFEELNGFDDNFFIWFEEVDLCKRAETAGYITFFLPSAVIKHSKGRSFTKKGILWRQWHFARSARIYFLKHHNLLSALLIIFISYISLIPALLVYLFNKIGVKFSQSVDNNF